MSFQIALPGFTMTLRGIQPDDFLPREKCIIIQEYAGFPIRSAGICEDDCGGFTLVVYRNVPEQLTGLVEDTYCYPCTLI